MEHDQRYFLELLQEYKSDDTKKARRNLSAIAFIVISVSFLKIPLNQVKLIGVDISHSGELSVLFLATGLLLYWLIMFLLSWKHDKEIQAERARFLDSNVQHFRERYQQGEEQRKTGDSRYYSADYIEAKTAVKAYEAQQKRTAQAIKYGSIIRGLELFVPLLLFGIAIAVLTASFLRH